MSKEEKIKIIEDIIRESASHINDLGQNVLFESDFEGVSEKIFEVINQINKPINY